MFSQLDIQTDIFQYLSSRFDELDGLHSLTSFDNHGSKYLTVLLQIEVALADNTLPTFKLRIIQVPVPVVDEAITSGPTLKTNIIS